jgi:hypothetical protein
MQLVGSELRAEKVEHRGQLSAFDSFAIAQARWYTAMVSGIITVLPEEAAITSFAIRLSVKHCDPSVERS